MDLNYQCASCGKTNDVFIEAELGHHQQLVEDCSVCCRPMVITARWNEWSQNFDLEVYQEDLG